jgi:aspartate/tyrosine/aromatic aminotransferase
MNSEKVDLRKEGAEELRQEILKELNDLIRRSWSSQERHGYQTAMVIVERTQV